jgi:F-box protein 9
MEQKEADSELEKFRKAWKEEVSAKTRQTGAAGSTSSNKPAASGSARPSHQSRHSKQIKEDPYDPFDGVYHDLEEKAAGHTLKDDGNLQSKTEPVTALDFYEAAVEKEGQGNLGSAVNHYRKAFKLDDSVQDKYKKKHFPTQKAPTAVTASSSAQPTASTPPRSVHDLVAEFSQLSILPAAPDTNLSPPLPCPISGIPDEILVQILQAVGQTDPASYSRLAQVCKRLSFLISAEDILWRDLCHSQDFGFQAMHYDFPIGIDGSPILGYEQLPKTIPLIPEFPTYRLTYRSRPRIRFGGCYISTVNYTRPGAVSSNHITWNAPILIVTYYRYLRFFRDGSIISLLTTNEPSDTIPYIKKEYLADPHLVGSNLPQAVMKDALRGRWRLTGDPYGEKRALMDEEYEDEAEGDVIIESDGVVPRYMFKSQLGFASSGQRAKNNKLTWKGHWSYNKLTDDWGEFEMKNYKPYYWSRVRSYGT